ncbi:putative GPI-anchored protein At1g61900 isoform X2 [Bidens hawaiensis]|uniref:putative GPI-anchored protein At1g61900 isoform X2 n=1 Tax=Bidens hawaiensis TaxID=980011 RepID=UPI004049F864
MDSVKAATLLEGSLCFHIFLFTVLLSYSPNVISKNLPPPSQLVSLPSSGIFQPIEISPSVLPNYPYLGRVLPPMYPYFPKTYKPVLTGRCPFNFSSISNIMEKTAADCSVLLASYVENVICCPQFASSLHIFQGHFSQNTDSLVLQNTTTADDCFKDIVEVLASKGAYNSILLMCSYKSSNLTGGSCPIKDISTFEKTVNTSKLLDACSVIDPLKECCRSVCQPAIMEAAFQISSSETIVDKSMNTGLSNVDVLNDCKGVVFSWLARKLPSDAADTSFRILSACKVNKVCPLEMKEPVGVIKACKNVAAPSPSCCSSLNSYIAGVQRQMLITNKQAILCASFLGSMLRKGGVLDDVYELCDVDLKDFSLQASGGEGCLLRSLPADVGYDNSSGFSFTCDLSDNIAAPWPSSSSMTSFSLCAPEMSLPALPTSDTVYHGCNGWFLDVFMTVVVLFVVHLNDLL